MTKPKTLEPVCNCPPNSPFRLAGRRSDAGFVALLRTSEKLSRKSKRHLAAERDKGNDIAFIPGLSKKSKRPCSA